MKLIILDRDGTINVDRDDYVKSADEWLPLPNALEAIAKLNQAGYTIVVATNQSGVGRGLYGMAELNAMHRKMHSLLRAAGGRIDAIFFCPHTPQDACNCRKPLPGLFTQIKERYGLDMSKIHTVGDTLRDLQAAAALGCHLHLVRTGKSQFKLPSDLPVQTKVHSDLMAFAQYLTTCV